MTSQGFDIVPIDEVDITSIVWALSEVFGPRSTHWYQWKHHDNPAGPSLGWAAVDDQGVIGIRLFQQWNLTAGSRSLKALRPVDTMTLPRARRRGVFRELLATALEYVHTDGRYDLIFNTPNQNSRDGYAKSGWTLLPEITHGRIVTSPGHPFGESTTIDHLPVGPFDTGGRLATSKSPDYVAWRFDARAGHPYLATIDTSASGESSIVYRVASRRGVRTLILLEMFGHPSSIRRIVTGTARRERAPLTLLAAGPGTGSVLRPHFNRGSSILAVRPLRPLEPEPLKLASWHLSLGDLEDVL